VQCTYSGGSFLVISGQLYPAIGGRYTSLFGAESILRVEETCGRYAGGK
jgi:hypothetical protein